MSNLASETKNEKLNYLFHMP